MQIYATHIATNGDNTIASTTETTDFQFTHDPPNKPTAAPTKPPIRACEDDEGRLTLHVKKFQKIAANNAENTAVQHQRTLLVGACKVRTSHQLTWAQAERARICLNQYHQRLNSGMLC